MQSHFIARDSIHYAAAVCSSIVAAVDRLATFPLQGRTVPEWQRPELENSLRARTVSLIARDRLTVEILTVSTAHCYFDWSVPIRALPNQSVQQTGGIWKRPRPRWLSPARS